MHEWMGGWKSRWMSGTRNGLPNFWGPTTRNMYSVRNCVWPQVQDGIMPTQTPPLEAVTHNGTESSTRRVDGVGGDDVEPNRNGGCKRGQLRFRQTGVTMYSTEHLEVPGVPCAMLLPCQNPLWSSSRLVLVSPASQPELHTLSPNIPQVGSYKER